MRRAGHQWLVAGLVLAALALPLGSPSRCLASQTHVLAVGVSRQNDPALPGAAYADADARSLAGLWAGPGKMAAAQSVQLVNEQATRENIRKAIAETLSRAQPEDVVIFFFAGHGLLTEDKSKRQTSSLLPYDAVLGKEASYYSLDTLFADFRQHVRAKHVLFLLDCCHSGGAGTIRDTRILMNRTISARSEAVEAYVEGAQKERQAQWGVLTSCRPEELARGTDKFKHGFFTFWLAHGLQGLADLRGEGSVGNGDGLVTFNELSHFVYHRVKRSTRDTQHPVLSGLFHPEKVLYRVTIGPPTVPDDDEFLGVLVLSLSPTDAVVVVNGERVAASDAAKGIKLVPGVHSLSVNRKGFLSAVGRVQVSEGGRKEVDIQLKPDTKTFQMF